MSDDVESIRQMLIGPLADELESARPEIPRLLQKQFVELVEEHFGEDLRNKPARSQFIAIARALGEHWSGEGNTNA